MLPMSELFIEVLWMVTPLLPFCLIDTDVCSVVNEASISFKVVATTEASLELMTIL